MHAIKLWLALCLIPCLTLTSFAYELKVTVVDQKGDSVRGAVVTMYPKQQGENLEPPKTTPENGEVTFDITVGGFYDDGDFSIQAEGVVDSQRLKSDRCEFTACRSGSVRNVVLMLDRYTVTQWTPPQPTVQEPCVYEAQQPVFTYSDGCTSCQPSVAYGTGRYVDGGIVYESRIRTDAWGRPVVDYGYVGSYPSYCPPSYQPGFFGGCFGW